MVASAKYLIAKINSMLIPGNAKRIMYSNKEIKIKVKINKEMKKLQGEVIVLMVTSCSGSSR